MRQAEQVHDHIGGVRVGAEGGLQRLDVLDPLERLEDRRIADRQGDDRLADERAPRVAVPLGVLADPPGQRHDERAPEDDLVRAHHATRGKSGPDTWPGLGPSAFHSVPFGAARCMARRTTRSQHRGVPREGKSGPGLLDLRALVVRIHGGHSNSSTCAGGLPGRFRSRFVPRPDRAPGNAEAICGKFPLP
jgi:hypothetical protein